MEERKPNRRKCHDYSSCGSYFITICTKDKEKLLGRVVGAVIGRPPVTILSDYGSICDKAINNISKYYPYVNVDRYVVMPNHIHLLLTVNDGDGRPMTAPTGVSGIVNQLKGAVSKEIGRSIWQKSFHDRVVRNDDEYNLITQYIIDNPSRWSEDKYFI